MLRALPRHFGNVPSSIVQLTAVLCVLAVTGLASSKANADEIPPVANDDFAFTEMNGPVDIDLLLNDYGMSCYILVPQSIELFMYPAHGNVMIDYYTGVATYSPMSGYEGGDDFLYAVLDLHGNRSNFAWVGIAVGMEDPGFPGEE